MTYSTNRALITLIFGAFLVLNCNVNSSNSAPGELEAKIKVTANFINDLNSIDGRRIKSGDTVTFTDNSDGDPDSWEWTFSDGREPVSGESASITWDEAVGEITVTLTVTRSSDGTTSTDEVQIQVGPVEMLSRAMYGLEDQDADFDALTKWFYWTPNDGTVTLEKIEGDGANNTSQSLKITANSGYGEFQLRPHETGSEFLVSLESNKTYVFSFYLKASEEITLSEAAFLNVKNDAPVEGWYTPFWSGEEEYGPINVPTEWTKYSYEFTTDDFSTFGDEGYADGTADNAGPFFKHFSSFSGSSISVWVDEMSIKEAETN